MKKEENSLLINLSNYFLMKDNIYCYSNINALNR